LALFAYFCVNLLVATLFDPNFDAKVPWDAVYESYPILSIISALSIGVVLLFWGANLFQKFWNRLVSDIFSVRALEYQESLAIVLTIAIIVA
jgi:hypothetical protein